MREARRRRKERLATEVAQELGVRSGSVTKPITGLTPFWPLRVTSPPIQADQPPAEEDDDA